jgi:hypothetical protein
LDLKNDIDSTISLISGLDVVVTVGNAVSGMAASIGKPILLILGAKGFDNFGTNYFPFFPTAECFIPYENESISDCIPRVAARLAEITK